MKKKFLLMLAMLAILVCVFALSVSAANDLKPQNSNAYGELSFFDESISVGRTNPQYGFTPYIDAEHTTYARVVIGDGTTFYTFPAAYVISETTRYGDGQKSVLVWDLTSLNKAMETVTGKNPGWTKGSIYRFEMPYNMVHVNGDDAQKFSGWSNVIEIYLQPNTSVKDKNNTMTFWKCINLETIHNLDSFVFREGCLGGSFEGCAKLTSITLGVSPEVTGMGENFLNGCTSLQSINFKEAFPNLKTIGKNAFYNCTSLKSISTDGKPNEFVMQNSVTSVGLNAFYNCKSMHYVSMSTSLTTINQGAFQSCTGLKTLSIPTSVTEIHQVAFEGCKSLLFVDFNDTTNVFNVDKYGQFQNCTSLLAVSLPDNYKLIPNRMFAGCTSLKAVYLPGNLVTMETNNWGDDPFNNCTHLYFVKDPFEVVDENGNFYTAETFVQPERPDVYFMPETLTNLCINKTSGKCFTGSYNLNPVIVFGKNMTRTTLGDGIFFECGSNGKLGDGVTAVFLGDMEQLKVHLNSNRGKGVKYIFANVNDKSLADVNVISNTNNAYNMNDKTEGLYFCYGNCHYLFNGVKFKGTYDDTVLTKLEGTIHIANPKKTVVTPETCTANREEFRYCFCNAEIGTVEIENTAGHISVFVDLVYEDFSTDGYYFYRCERCGAEDKEDAPALFDCVGYSASTFGKNGLAIGFKVDKEAIYAYEEATGKTVEYGAFAVAKEKIGNNDIFDANGNLANNVSILEASNYDFLTFELVIVGFTDKYMDKKLAMGAYVAVTEGEATKYSYMQFAAPNEGEKYSFVSYNEILGVPSTDEA